MKKSIDLSSGLWTRVERCSKNLHITIPDLVEHCLVRRIRKIESKHMKRINLGATKHTATPKAKPRVASKRKHTTAKKTKLAPVPAA